jgi:hypothetical protein
MGKRVGGDTPVNPKKPLLIQGGLIGFFGNWKREKEKLICIDFNSIYGIKDALDTILCGLMKCISLYLRSLE